jgi:hypothetical protein
MEVRTQSKNAGNGGNATTHQTEKENRNSRLVAVSVSGNRRDQVTLNVYFSEEKEGVVFCGHADATGS